MDPPADEYSLLFLIDQKTRTRSSTDMMDKNWMARIIQSMQHLGNAEHLIGLIF